MTEPVTAGFNRTHLSRVELYFSIASPVNSPDPKEIPSPLTIVLGVIVPLLGVKVGVAMVFGPAVLTIKSSPLTNASGDGVKVAVTAFTVPPTVSAVKWLARKALDPLITKSLLKFKRPYDL